MVTQVFCFAPDPATAQQLTAQLVGGRLPLRTLPDHLHHEPSQPLTLGSFADWAPRAPNQLRRLLLPAPWCDLQLPQWLTFGVELELVLLGRRDAHALEEEWEKVTEAARSIAELQRIVTRKDKFGALSALDAAARNLRSAIEDMRSSELVFYRRLVAVELNSCGLCDWR